MSSYGGGQVAAFVPADPAQAADDIKHLQLELRKTKREKEMKARCKKHQQQPAYIKEQQNNPKKKSKKQAQLHPPPDGQLQPNVHLGRFWMFELVLIQDMCSVHFKPGDF